MASPKWNVKWSGLDRFDKDLAGRLAQYMLHTAGALYEEAEVTTTEAKELTPVDEGNLRASGHVQLPKQSKAGSISVEMGFGGPAGAGQNTQDVGYAVHVHEDLQAHHNVGQAKFLQQPVEKRRHDFGQRIVKRVRERLAI